MMVGPRPAGLLQAFADLSRNRLFELVARHWIWSLVIGALVTVGLGLLGDDAQSLGLAVPVCIAIIVLAYQIAQRRFAAMIRQREPVCPTCKAVVWQLLCSNCRQPVPVLAMMLRGLFLSHCPHCRGPLAGGALDVSCHSCGATTTDARTHLRRNGIIEIELGASLPEVPASWALKSQGRYQELQRASREAFTVVFRITHEQAPVGVLPESTWERLSRLWIGQAVNPQTCRDVLGAIPEAARRRTELRFEQSVSPSGVVLTGYRTVRFGVARPSEQPVASNG